MGEHVRVLIVDDSALVRRALREILGSDPDIQIIGEAANGKEALALAEELRPDLITMDVRMPVMDGVETTEQLMAYRPTPILVITASLNRYDVDISFKMLGAGALEVMEKPNMADREALERVRRELVQRVKFLARVRVVTHLRGRRRNSTTDSTPLARLSLPPIYGQAASLAPAPSLPVEQASSLSPVVPTKPAKVSGPAKASLQPIKPKARRAAIAFPLVVIGASTGGPRVVQRILMGLPKSFPAALVVVQHIAEGFSAGMVEWLSDTCELPTKLAVEGSQLAQGLVLVAPDGHDLAIQRGGYLHLTNQQFLLHRPSPSVDVTMQTAAEIFGSQAIGVLLTGMGRDGAIGMQQIHQAGGYTIAQNEATCTIYGMPRAAVEAGAAHEILAPDDIILALQRRINSA